MRAARLAHSCLTGQTAPTFSRFDGPGLAWWAGLLLVAALAAPRAAEAQWTLPQGQLVVSTGFDFQYADSEFFGMDGEPRRERAFPLDGRYYGATMTLDARLGVTDELELELVAPLRVVAYTADPVILLDAPMGSAESMREFYQRNVIDLSTANAGLADLRFIGRYRFLREPFLLTGELGLKVPGGYAGPEGTFGADPQSSQALLDQLATRISPDNVSDDVTLGDGQVDLFARLHWGVAFDTGTFLAGDAGYNARFDDAGHQVLASLRAGQLIEGRVLLFAGASFGISVTEGRVIGVSVAAMDPSLPAEEYGGLNNLMLREVRLQRDYLDVYGGLIFRLNETAEIKLAYARTVWGRNTAAVSTFTIGVGARTTLFEPPGQEPADDYEDEEADYEDDEAYADEAPADGAPEAYPATDGGESAQ